MFLDSYDVKLEGIEFLLQIITRTKQAGRASSAIVKVADFPTQQSRTSDVSKANPQSWRKEAFFRDDFDRSVFFGMVYICFKLHRYYVKLNEFLVCNVFVNYISN